MIINDGVCKKREAWNKDALLRLNLFPVSGLRGLLLRTEHCRKRETTFLFESESFVLMRCFFISRSRFNRSVSEWMWALVDRFVTGAQRKWMPGWVQSDRTSLRRDTNDNSKMASIIKWELIFIYFFCPHVSHFPAHSLSAFSTWRACNHGRQRGTLKGPTPAPVYTVAVKSQLFFFSLALLPSLCDSYEVLLSGHANRLFEGKMHFQGIGIAN